MMSNSEIDAKIEQIRKIEAQSAKLEEAINKLKDELRAELDTRKVDAVNTGIHKVFYNIYSQSRVDAKALKDAGLYDLYSKKQEVVQFRITDVNVY